MKKMIGLAGRESGFLHRLMDYVNGRSEAEVFLCTREDSFLSEIQRREPAVMFCMEEFARDMDLPVPRVDFVLEQEREDGIYQFQPAPDLYKEMKKYIWKEAPRRRVPEGGQQIVAVYSPLGRSGKTSFACAYARAHSFFYLCMEEYGIKTNDFCAEGGLLYHIKNRRADIVSYMMSLAEEWEGIQIIGAPTVFTDSRWMEEEDFSWFFSQIRGDRRMPSVIVDFGSSTLVDFEILDLFDRVFLPILTGHTEERKLHQFKELLYETNGRMEDKLKEIIVPPTPWQHPEFMGRIQYMDGLIYE